jgi:hypothetical protein
VGLPQELDKAIGWTSVRHVAFGWRRPRVQAPCTRGSRDGRSRPASAMGST